MTYHDASAVVAEIDDVAACLHGCYTLIPPDAQASVLKLAHSLSLVRTRLVAHCQTITVSPTNCWRPHAD